MKYFMGLEVAPNTTHPTTAPSRDKGLAVRDDGWQMLTVDGLRTALYADIKTRADQRPYRKQQTIE